MSVFAGHSRPPSGRATPRGIVGHATVPGQGWASLVPSQDWSWCPALTRCPQGPLQETGGSAGEVAGTPRSLSTDGNPGHRAGVVGTADRSGRLGAERAPGPAAQTRGLPAGAVCLVCFLSTTCFALQSGSYWLEIFDNHLASVNLILLAFFEVVSVAYVYGLER